MRFNRIRFLGGYVRITSMTQLRGQLGEVVKVTRGHQVTFHRVQQSCISGQYNLVGAETIVVDADVLAFLYVEHASNAEAAAFRG